MNPTKWSEVFRRVRPGVCNTRAEFWQLLDSESVRGLADASAGGERLMAGGMSAYAFLDGGVVYSEHEDPSAWDSDWLGTGIWVVGDEALDAVCEVLELVPPRRNTARMAQTGRNSSVDAQAQAEALFTWNGISSLQLGQGR